MTDAEVIIKADRGEGLTAPEVLRYQQLVKPVEHVYGKYGTLAKIYLAEHNSAKEWALGGDLPKYLHGVDKAADRLYKIMYKKLSALEKYKHTDSFMDNLRKETEIQQLIDEEILSEIVYVD